MGIQTSDQGLLRDTVTVLEGLGTRLSDTFAEVFTGFLEPSSARGDTAIGPATHAEIAEFRKACERHLVVTNHALDSALSHTTLLDCLCVAILFGQLANEVELGSANSFVHEMEFLASCQPRAQFAGQVPTRQPRGGGAGARPGPAPRCAGRSADADRRVDRW